MLLEQIIDTIKYGELSNISVESEEVPKIINFINLGLIQLYSKFPIVEKQVVIQQYNQISLYVLDYRFARSNINSLMPHRYILDTPEDPFMDDVMFITGVCDEWGRPVSLNDDHDPHSYFLVSHNTVQIPNANEHNSTFIIYRAKPKRIRTKEYNMMEEVILPEYLLEALSAYVGFKAMQSMTSEEGSALSDKFLDRYNTLVNEVQQNNLMNSNVSPTNIKLGFRGYK